MSGVCPVCWVLGNLSDDHHWVEDVRDRLDDLNDWCEDQLISWGDSLDAHYGLWVVCLLVFLVIVLSVFFTLEVMS